MILPLFIDFSHHDESNDFPHYTIPKSGNPRTTFAQWGKTPERMFVFRATRTFSTGSQRKCRAEQRKIRNMGFMNEIVQKVEQFNRESRERFQERLNSFESNIRTR